jgi:hypothetical protein
VRDHRELAKQFLDGADRAETLEGVQTFTLLAIAHTLLCLNHTLVALHHTLQHRPPTTRLPVQLCADTEA